MLYLHEIIDIIGDGQQAYLDAIGERAAHSEREGVSRLMGSWRMIGSTSRWPRVVNLWEMDGWNHWAESLERQFLPHKQETHLPGWWSTATQWRSGGFDRILEPTPYSPTRDQLRTRGLQSWVCAQTIVRLNPGRRGSYLHAVGESLRPLLETCGLQLIGAYAAPMRSDEALMIWAAADFRQLCAIYGDLKNNAALREWTAQATPMRRELETMWLAPGPHCFFHPGPGV